MMQKSAELKAIDRYNLFWSLLFAEGMGTVPRLIETTLRRLLSSRNIRSTSDSPAGLFFDAPFTAFSVSA
jgi:cobalamin biosynthesis protein CobT